MKFNVATTPLELSKERQDVLKEKLDDWNIIYRFYEGEVTELHYDGLYKTAKAVIEDNKDSDFVVFAEDDLIFTDEFSIMKLESMIKEAGILGMDVLATGCSSSYEERKTNVKGLIEISGFRGTQLVVLFKSCYDSLLDAPDYNHFEDTISKMQPKLKIGLTLPFFSKQREDCPSIITTTNNNKWFTINEDSILSKLDQGKL